MENTGVEESAAKRRARTKQERRRTVEETFAAGVSVANVARAHGIRPNQVFHWRRLYHQELLGDEAETTALVPVRITNAGTCSGYTRVQPQRLGAQPANWHSARFRSNSKKHGYAFMGQPVDFVTVPTFTFKVLFVFVVLAHRRREVLPFNVTEHPTAEWIAQQVVEAFADGMRPST